MAAASIPIRPARSLTVKDSGIFTFVGLGLIMAFCFGCACCFFLAAFLLLALLLLISTGGAKPSSLVSGTARSISSGAMLRLSLPFCGLARRGLSSRAFFPFPALGSGFSSSRSLTGGAVLPAFFFGCCFSFTSGCGTSTGFTTSTGCSFSAAGCFFSASAAFGFLTSFFFSSALLATAGSFCGLASFCFSGFCCGSGSAFGLGSSAGLSSLASAGACSSSFAASLKRPPSGLLKRRQMRSAALSIIWSSTVL